MIYKNKFKKAPSISFLMGIIYAVIGIIFLAVGIIVSVHNKEFFKNSKQTDAVISKIDKDYYRASDGERRTQHNVWVKYEVNGIQYEQLLDYYDSDMSEGDIVTVNYSPDDPSEIKTDAASKVLDHVIIPLGGAFVLLGLILMLKKLLSDQKRKRLIRLGECINGIITNVEINKFVTVNNRHPYRAECEVIDPYSGERLICRSDNITNDISFLIGREVTVYIDRKNKKNYFVDIYELIERFSSGENICDHEYRG